MADGTHHPDCSIPHDLILFVGECLSRCYRYGVAGVNPHRIQVFDRTDNDHVVVVIPEQLQFKPFPSEDALLDQDLVDGAEFKSAQDLSLELFSTPHNPRTATPQRKTVPGHTTRSDR